MTLCLGLAFLSWNYRSMFPILLTTHFSAQHPSLHEPLYHKFYLGIKLMVQQKCGYLPSLSHPQTNSERNVLRLNLVKPKPKESNFLWKMILSFKKKSSKGFASYPSGSSRVKLTLYSFSFWYGRSSIWREIKYPQFSKSDCTILI